MELGGSGCDWHQEHGSLAGTSVRTNPCLIREGLRVFVVGITGEILERGMFNTASRSTNVGEAALIVGKSAACLRIKKVTRER